MIVKHVPMRSVRKSDFAELTQYLSDPKDRTERVGDVRIANCYSEELGDAAMEVLATQARNVRAVSDKTYHLIVSFRAGENPGPAAMGDIEQRLCASLGYAEHQRISVVHHDTDNLHMHIAINKIHPARLTLHEPFLAYRTFASLCPTLESEHGLEPDNHEAKKRGAENRAADIEHAGGIESLLGWIKRECLKDIQSAESWEELHQAMRDNGLILRERGAGLVIEAGNGTMVKASSVSRDLSKSKLEIRYGDFQPSSDLKSDQRPPAKRVYEPRPVRSHIDTTELYARYKVEQQGKLTARSIELQQARDGKDRKIAAAKNKAKLTRTTIKLIGGRPMEKRALYALASHALQSGIQNARADNAKELQALNQRHRRHSWNDWLQQQAKAGNAEALEALRAREATQGLKGGNSITGKPSSRRSVLAMPGHVTKQGTLVYRIGKTAIRDDGKRLNVALGASQGDLTTILQVAAQRYGQVLTIAGSPEFKEQIVQAAATAKLSVRFDDPDLERRRLTLLLTQQGRVKALSARPHGVQR